MATKEIERKIAVIFATDVVGYSKSVEKNEDQTIKNFRACKKILEDLFKEHDGRIFNTAGDSVLAEFSSAVSAVICATIPEAHEGKKRVRDYRSKNGISNWN